MRKLEQHRFCGSKHCPGCGHKLQAKPDWVGLPAGVKFDPTDQELIEHLEAKVKGKEMKSHPLIDEFIPTIEGDDGICYTHPEKLPGVKRDGLSRHFFHRPSKAYTTGTRKRRKIIIQNESSPDVPGGGGTVGETRWHKTGKTRPVMVNGRQRGCKKILVLYTNFGKNRRPEKTNWVMHQYHLGLHEEEREGELVVSKIFYQTQPRQCSWSSSSDHHRSNSSGPAGDGRDSCGSGSCSYSNKEIGAYNNLHVRDETSVDISRFLAFGRSFDEGIGEASTGRESMQVAGTREEIHGGISTSPSSQHHHMTHGHRYHHHHQQQQQHPTGATNALLVSSSSSSSSSSSHPIPAIISHPSSELMNVDELNSFNIPRIMLPNVPFQQQQHYHKLERRSGSGLEDLIMGCSSTTPTTYSKDESSIPNPQEAEWLKYSSFWPDPYYNQYHHG